MRAPWRWLMLWRSYGETTLADALNGQISAVGDGAALALEMVSKRISPADARKQIAVIEQRGDQERAKLVQRLSRTLVAPLDREDLFRLSRSIDDVLDTIRDFIREAHLYQIEKRRIYRPFVDSTVVAIDLLAEAVDALWTNPRRVPRKALDAKKAAREVGREYQTEFAKIVDGTITPKTLKHRELIKRLDWVGVRISDAADVLTDGALKRGF